jgi:sugar lactone lactonase YvrE
LDGTGAKEILTIRDAEPHGIALDVPGNMMYWVEHLSGKIRRANLDGSGVEEFPYGLSGPRGIALDVAGGKIYWAEEGGDGKIYWAEEGGDGDPRIRRSNLDGTGVENLVTTGLSSTTEIELDVPGGKMYWADHGTSRVQRSNLDGSEVEDIVTAGSADRFGGPYGIALY